MNVGVLKIVNFVNRMILIISTLPHFLSVIPRNTYKYKYVIILSTTLSILYHYNEESNTIINILDYCMAFIWFLCDIYLGHNRYKIILVNFISFIINVNITTNYTLYHSIWHIINASKCYYVAMLLSNSPIPS